MASLVVLDSGIALATILEEPYSDKAKTLIEGWIEQKAELAAPVLLRYEVIAVLRHKVYRGQLTPDEALSSRDTLLSLGITFHVDNGLLKRAYELATQLNRPSAYDAQYLAVAERLNCEFWTADERLFNAIHTALPWVKWLGDFAP